MPPAYVGSHKISGGGPYVDAFAAAAAAVALVLCAACARRQTWSRSGRGHRQGPRRLPPLARRGAVVGTMGAVVGTSRPVRGLRALIHAVAVVASKVRVAFVIICLRGLRSQTRGRDRRDRLSLD